jgi:hypothetical protein
MRMANVGYERAALFEHRFWLQIMGDHARFIYRASAPVEKEAIQQAYRFIQGFDQLLGQARGLLDQAGIQQLNRQSWQMTNELRQFKLDLLRRELVGMVAIGIGQTFFNHMVNELEAYLHVLGFLNQGQVPPAENPLNYHLIWLTDAAAHAGVITSDVDETEKQMKRKSQQFAENFTDFYLKSIELAGYLRTNLSDFPALSRFNHDVELELAIFKSFLRELEELAIRRELLGIFTPLMADHMAREECYYLHKLAEATGAKPPECDPGKPRATSL